MGIIKDLAFLEKDPRFRESLSKEFQKDFEWYFEFDNKIKPLLKSILDRINQNDLSGVYDLLTKIENICTKEYRFIAVCKTIASKNLMLKELHLLEDALQRLGIMNNIFAKTGNYIVQQKKTQAIIELNKIFELL
ncbi:MAG: hypothetical protein NTY99_03205 [DPANN group archaeon]|nr:hypothetical protein [DPANN group archaeon]